MNRKSDIVEKAAKEAGIEVIKHPAIRHPLDENIDEPRICPKKGEECLSDGECHNCRFDGEKVAKGLMYRINIRPLWKNNPPRVYWPLAHQIAEILKEESGFSPWYEDTIKCFKFMLENGIISMKTIIALQAIGYNNGGYVLSIERVL